MRRSSVYSVLDTVATWLLPPRCVLCGGPGQPAGLDLCPPCERELPWLAAACRRCGLPSAAPQVGAAGAAVCETCRVEPPPYARCHAPFLYEFPLTRLVPSLKYEGALANARALGMLLSRSVERAGLHRDVDVIVPMPLHPSRLESRGFNQSQEIARIVGRTLGIPLAPSALRRTRPTAPQVGLARAARRDNVQGAFTAEARLLHGRRIALLDDVVTTGSTVAVAAQSLVEAGVRSVDVWCVARAEG